MMLKERRYYLFALLVLLSLVLYLGSGAVDPTGREGLENGGSGMLPEPVGYDFHSSSVDNWTPGRADAAFTMYYYTVSNLENHALCLLAKSATQIAGTTLNVVTDIPMTETTHTLKGVVMAKIVAAHDPNDVIVFFDAFDVLASRPIAEMARDYATKFYPKMVVSGHRICHPNWGVRYKDRKYLLDGVVVPSDDICGRLKANHPDAPRPYINSGTLVGRAADIASILPDYEDLIKQGHRRGDQEILTLIHLNHTDRMAVDADADLVLTFKMKGYEFHEFAGTLCEHMRSIGNPKLIHLPGFTAASCVLEFQRKYEDKPAKWRVFETGVVRTETQCMDLFHPSFGDRSDLLLHMEYYRKRWWFFTVFATLALAWGKMRFLDPWLARKESQPPFPGAARIIRILRNRGVTFLLAIVVVILPPMYILLFDGWNDGK